jgi:hypothetical protein
MFTVAVTDRDWFEQLRDSSMATVNYWSPTPWNPDLKRLEVGSPFCFMVKGHRKIGGYGLFQHYENLHASEAWANWGNSNGVGSLADLVDRTQTYAKLNSKPFAPSNNPEIGCFILTDVVYFADTEMLDAVAVGIDFPRQIMKDKYFEGTPSFVGFRPLAYPPYRRANDLKVSETRSPFEVDPEAVDRGTNAHMKLQNALEDFAANQGFEPKGPHSSSPNFDIGWYDGDTFVVVEVKSLSSSNELGQMRLGIGQILDYAHYYESREEPFRAVLAVEREPDSHWLDLCANHGIRLVWPGTFERALS